MTDADITFDADSPQTKPGDWDNAIVSHSLSELHEKVAVRRGARGKQKSPVKAPTSIRFDPEVLEAFRATGRGWQTRMNDALKEWLREHAA